jgi:hypothetical protein
MLPLSTYAFCAVVPKSWDLVVMGQPCYDMIIEFNRDGWVLDGGLF